MKKYARAFSLKFQLKIFSRVTIFMFLLMNINGCKKDFKSTIPNETTDDNSGPFSPALARQPNIILIIGDDVGYEIPTYTGGQSYNTPNLDLMAQNGIQFTQAYCHPDGFPSRLAALSGKYNFRNYIKWGILPPGGHTIANMLHGAGYATCYVGKWQNDGGDEGIKAAGFDKYRVFLPFSYPSNQFKGRYKSPILYENGNYLPDSVTAGRYSEDMNVEYLSNFIHDNKKNPFFAIYSMPLIQKPWVPTPDDPEYASWNPTFDEQNQDVKYFPSMVNYMDKKIGDVMNALQQNGVKNNTLVLFTTDNGTNVFIHSIYNGVNRKGNKNMTTLFGIRIPLVATWPAKIQQGQVTNTIVNFTDFLPTFADVAGISKPTDYGALDGISFYDNLRNKKGVDRSWSFCYWDNSATDNKPMVKYVNDTMYKLYYTPLLDSFFNTKKDVKEKMKLNLNQLTPQEQLIRNEFIQVFQAMHN